MATASGVKPGDVALAVAVAGVTLLSLWLRTPILADLAEGSGTHPVPSPAVAVLILLTCAPLAWRRQAPGTVLVSIVALTVMTEVELSLPLALPYSVLAAVYTVALLWPRAYSLGALAATLVVVSAGEFLVGGGSPDDEALMTTLAILTVWALGHSGRLRQAESALLAERARLLEDHAHHLADEQAALARLAVEGERAAIARELHDIVANNIGVVVAWAAAGSRRALPSPDRDTLRAIEELGRETLRDIRRLVGVLHVHDHSAADDSPRLDRLPALVKNVRATGTRVTLEMTGTVRELPAAVELNAYRIVQESLTNAMKHAAGSHVDVLVAYHDCLLHLRVRDHGGRDVAPDHPGSGLFGMRQRVAVLGGSLATGPAVDQPGFVVDAQIPLTPTA